MAADFFFFKKEGGNQTAYKLGSIKVWVKFFFTFNFLPRFDIEKTLPLLFNKLSSHSQRTLEAWAALFLCTGFAIHSAPKLVLDDLMLSKRLRYQILNHLSLSLSCAPSPPPPPPSRYVIKV